MDQAQNGIVAQVVAVVDIGNAYADIRMKSKLFRKGYLDACHGKMIEARS